MELDAYIYAYYILQTKNDRSLIIFGDKKIFSSIEILFLFAAQVEIFEPLKNHFVNELVH